MIFLFVICSGEVIVKFLVGMIHFLNNFEKLSVTDVRK